MLSERRAKLFLSIEWGCCLLATGLGVALHIVFLLHAGGLWRDEAGGVQLATLPPVREVWRMLEHDAFPALFPGMVRVWSALGLGGTDFGLRVLGFLIGVATIGAFWASARLMGLRTPAISLGLLAANVTFVRFSDSLRGYGCGCLFIVLTLGLIWWVLQRPGLGRFLLAALAAVLSVQALYQNAFLVLAGCGAGCAVCARRRHWRAIPWVLGAGLFAAVSLVPYMPHIVESQTWFDVAKAGFPLDVAWDNLVNALGLPLQWPVWLWLGLVGLALAAGTYALRDNGKKGLVVANDPDLPLFGGAAVLIGIVTFSLFLKMASMPARPWYYLPLMLFVALSMDAAVAGLALRFKAGWGSLLVPLFGAVIAVIMFPGTLKLVKYRQTNVDLIAAELRAKAGPGDFIIVTRWYCGITFGRYYHGKAGWATLPPITDNRFHRYDLFKQALCMPTPIQPILDRAAQALASGHALWIVGPLPQPRSDQPTPPELPPAPIPGRSWSELDNLYVKVWRAQTSYFVANHARQAEVLRVGSGVPVSPYEELGLMRITGWQGN
jgi:hypothetical protein